MPARLSPEALEAYRVLGEAADDAILIGDVGSGRFVEANRVALGKLGYSLAELRERTGRDISQLSLPLLAELNQSLRETGEARARNVSIRRRDESLWRCDFWTKRFEVNGVAYHMTMLRDAQGGVSRGESRDADYRGLVEFGDDAVFVCRHDDEVFVEANAATQELFGYSIEELESLTLADLLPHAEAEVDGMRRRLHASRGARVSDVVMTRKDDTSFHAHLRLAVHEAANTKLIVGIARDITQQREREQQLREASQRLATSEATYRGLVACTNDAVIIADFESAFCVEANPAACALFGYSGPAWNQLVGRDLHPPETRPTIDEMSRLLHERGSTDMRDVPTMKKDGSIFFADIIQNVFEAAGRKLIVSVLRDGTERRRQAARLERSYDELQRAQAKALHAQKLAAVGEVAAGVAHEINNPAAFVSMNLDAMQAELRRLDDLLNALHGHIAREEDRDRKRVLHALLDEHSVDVRGLRAMLHDNRDGIERIRSVTHDLRLFSRVEQQEVVAVDLNAVVRSTVKLLMNELRHRAAVTIDLGNVPLLPAERGKLAQVVTNLVLNASHAIVEGAADSNEITVVTRCEGDHVVLVVEDSGMGMDEQTCARIFDPFFTTKPREQGTGLGLSLCAEIVAKHGGQMMVQSTPGEGSRFEVRIPIVTGLSVEAETVRPPVEQGTARKRILVIDDDAGMVRAYRRMLVDHDAVVVSSGSQALALIHDGDVFDVIVCDLMMPEMDGPQVYENITLSAPELAGRMVFCTGGAFTARTREFISRVDNQVLDKPISRDDLERLLR